MTNVHRMDTTDGAMHLIHLIISPCSRVCTACDNTTGRKCTSRFIKSENKKWSTTTDNLCNQARKSCTFIFGKVKLKVLVKVDTYRRWLHSHDTNNGCSIFLNQESLNLGILGEKIHLRKKCLLFLPRKYMKCFLSIKWKPKLFFFSKKRQNIFYLEKIKSFLSYIYPRHYFWPLSMTL